VIDFVSQDACIPAFGVDAHRLAVLIQALQMGSQRTRTAKFLVSGFGIRCLRVGQVECPPGFGCLSFC
jgi:hypothetical protein